MSARRNGRLRLLVSLLLVLSFAVFVPSSATADGASLERRAIEVAAERLGADPARLVIEHAALAEFPLTGRSAHDFKVLDPTSHRTAGVALDASGRPVDVSSFELAEESARARAGKLHPRLAERMFGADPFETLQVAIWVKADGLAVERPEIPEGVTVSSQELDALSKQADAELAAKVAPFVAPVTAKLAAMGVVAEPEAYTPLLYAHLTPPQVRVVAEWTEVDTVYLVGRSATELDIARAVIRANTVHARTGCPSGATCDGNGVALGQVEAGGRVATANPNLPGVTQDATNVCSSNSAHSTAVAGMIVSRHATHRGISPFSTLRAAGSCSGDDSQLNSGVTRVADAGARAINNSYGHDSALVPDFTDRHLDGVFINRFRFIVKSAGNRGAAGCSQGTNGNITSPGLGYNTTTVGNFDDRNTTTFSDDVMATCSSWRDPKSTRMDREKPEVAAPGTSINSTRTASPWTGGTGSGTSYAAPMVTGTAGLLIDRLSYLSAWPEEIKAIIMASAVHNIEGSSRKSEFDGVGGLLSDRADDIARRAGGSSGHASATCSTTQTVNHASFSAKQGQRIRMVLVWNQDPTYANYAQQPGADLDLRLINPAGSVQSSSASYDNTYEVIEVTAPSSGTYKLQSHRHRCSNSPRYLGWAWMIG